MCMDLLTADGTSLRGSKHHHSLILKVDRLATELQVVSTNLPF